MGSHRTQWGRFALVLCGLLLFAGCSSAPKPTQAADQEDSRNARPYKTVDISDIRIGDIELMLEQFDRLTLQLEELARVMGRIPGYMGKIDDRQRRILSLFQAEDLTGKMPSRGGDIRRGDGR